MIGIIVCAHGNFASGVASAVKLIAGDQDKFIAIDFPEGDSHDTLKQNIETAINKLGADDGVVIFTDIPGGTPFNQSAMLTQLYKSVRVIAGTNLPAIFEVIFSRDGDVDSFVETALSAGKSGLTTFELKERGESSSDGI